MDIAMMDIDFRCDIHLLLAGSSGYEMKISAHSSAVHYYRINFW